MKFGKQTYWTIDALRNARESEDKVEFKRGEHGNVAYDGGTKAKPSDRRRCILGYVVALCNECGGSLVIGMDDDYPHKVVGTRQSENATGDLEANIYRDVGIRPRIYELYEDETVKTGRVLVIDVPSRPVGRVYKFEDVALMRVGEELKPMSDECYAHILQEQEPDFSSEICQDVTIADLDEHAITVMREKYSQRQHNPHFLSLSCNQILSDLGLVIKGKVTYAAIVLLAKETVIRRVLPQAAILVEYRSTEAQIPFDNRTVYRQPFFLMIDKLWHDINLRNGSFPVREGAYVFDVPYFNEDVIREAVNNAFAHRDYRRTSEIVIKLYPKRMTIVNAGGFPRGVTLENLLTVPSTPRNRLLADVLSKTGIVERSGQGVDKIFYNTLAEGKIAPDYSKSDGFKTELSLSASLQDRGFALFVEAEQQLLSDENKLTVFEIYTLAQIRDGVGIGELDKRSVDTLLRRGLIEKRGKTKATTYFLSRNYYEFCGKQAEYIRKGDWGLGQMIAIITPYLEKYKTAKMGDFAMLLDGHMTRRQVRVNIARLIDQQVLFSTGVRSGTRYQFTESYERENKILNEALKIGLNVMQNQICPKNVQELVKSEEPLDD